MIIPNYIVPIIDTLEKNGYEAYLVGGCVRDSLLSRIPNDYDLTSNAKPDEMCRIFKDYRVIETGLKHGTLTVMSEGEGVEITTYRIDGEYRDNRHPESVSFTDDITADLARRDFTVNAMAYSPTKGLCDPFGGQEDLKTKKISCVGEPALRFSEDGLRIIRALRFASVLDFSIEERTFAAVLSMKALLCGISKERIFVEFSKLLCGVGCDKILKKAPEVLSVCCDGILTPDNFVSASEKINSLPKDASVRIAYLCLMADNSEEVANRLLCALKSSTLQRTRVKTLCREAKRKLDADETEIKYLMSRMDGRDIPPLFALKRALGDFDGEIPAIYGKVAAENPCVKISSLAVNGGDVMKITGERGEKVGAYLSHLLKLVIEGKCENNRDALSAALLKLKAVNSVTP